MNTQLLNSLAQAKLLNSSDASLQETEIDSPWYIKVMLAFSGWLAAIFILGFFFSLFSRLYDNTLFLIIIGGGLIATAYFIFKNKKANEFLEHLGLASSLAGQSLLIVAINNELQISLFLRYEDIASLSLMMAFIQLTLALFMPNFVHRIFSTFFTVISLGVAILFFTKDTSLIALFGILVMLLTAVVWLNEFRFPKQIEKLRAFGYGLVLATIIIKAKTHFLHRNSSDIGAFKNLYQGLWFQPWMEQVILSAITLYVVWKLLQKVHPKPSQIATILAFVGVLIITALSFQAQGLLTGIMIILLGFSASNRVLLGLGTTALLYFIANYYYSLQNTLLDKSIILFVLGITLLAGRFIMLKLLPEQGMEKVIEGASS